MKATLLLAGAALLVQSALATVSITQPVASTTATGGKNMTIEWQDNGQAPMVTGAQWGRISIWLATGSVNTQYKLVQLADRLSPHTTSTSALIPANAGPNGHGYFLRFEGSRTDNATGYPVMAFSARFELTGMTGTFNSTILATNQGATDPITGTTGGTTGGSAGGSGGAANSPTTSSSAMVVITRPSVASAAPAVASTRAASSGASALGARLDVIAGVGLAALGAVALL